MGHKRFLRNMKQALRRHRQMLLTHNYQLKAPVKLHGFIQQLLFQLLNIFG